ncbi:feather beta keratin-like [Tyto alba]|uniref:feather beta keratin-like n=1 Tax=Tyto alba TaxID=56313 RepID=UPI001C67584E|nr:feather beta keratin-like [Tyto alba]
MLHEQGMFVAPQGSGTQHKSLRCSRLCILLSCFTFLDERALLPSQRDVLLQTLSPRPCCASGPTPLASSCSEPCVARCADSTVFIEPSPVVVTLPGPILNSFPQSTAVGSSLSAAVGSSLSASGVPISSGGSLGLGGSGMCLPVPRCSLNC